MWTVKIKWTDGKQLISRKETVEEAMKLFTNALGDSNLMYIKISPPKGT